MYSLSYVVQLLMYVACKLWVETRSYVDLDHFPHDFVMVVMNIMPMLCMMYCYVDGGVAVSDGDGNETLSTKTVQYYSIHPPLVSLDHQLWAVSHGASLMEEVRIKP